MQLSDSSVQRPAGKLHYLCTETAAKSIIHVRLICLISEKIFTLGLYTFFSSTEFSPSENSDWKQNLYCGNERPREVVWQVALSLRLMKLLTIPRDIFSTLGFWDHVHVYCFTPVLSVATIPYLIISYSMFVFECRRNTFSINFRQLFVFPSHTSIKHSGLEKRWMNETFLSFFIFLNCWHFISRCYSCNWSLLAGQWRPGVYFGFGCHGDYQCLLVDLFADLLLVKTTCTGRLFEWSVFLYSCRYCLRWWFTSQTTLVAAL